MQRYNFDRIRRGVGLMAEDIAVHADTLAEAEIEAQRLIPDKRTDTIRFRDNRPCPAACRCSICHAAATARPWIEAAPVVRRTIAG